MIEIAEYKGYKITFDDYEEYFTVLVGNERLRDKSLKSLKRQIDNATKEDFEKISAYHINNNYDLVTVTSLPENSTYHYKEAWIIGADKRRKKVMRTELVPVTEDTTKIVTEIKDKWQQIREIENEIVNLRDSLPKIRG